jgi:hypothetical protein
LPLNLLNAFNWEARDEELRNSKVCSRFLGRMETVSPLMCAWWRIMGVQCRSAAITDVVDSLGCLQISFGDGQTGLHFHFVVFMSCSIKAKSWWLAGGLQWISCHAPVKSVCRAWIYPRGYVYTCALLVHAQSVHKRTQKYWYLLVIFLGKSMLLAKGATNSNPLWKFSFVSKTRPQLWPTLKLFGREPGPRFVYWLQF